MMRMGWRIVIAMLLLATAVPAGAAEPLQWQNDLATAQRIAAQTNRLVLVHFGASWCPPCQRLERNVFSQPSFGTELASRYVAVKLDYDQHQPLAARYGVQAIPADVVLSPQGELVRTLPSPASAQQYVETFHQLAAGQTPGGHTTPDAQAVPGGQAVLPGGQDPHNGNGGGWAVSAPNGTAPSGPAPVSPAPVHQPYASQAPMMPPSATMPHSMPPVAGQSPPSGQYAAAPHAPAQHAPAQSVPQAALPPGSPPLGLEGFCPVTLVDRKSWQVGDVRFGAIHRGRTYLFTSAEAQQRFLSGPDQFSPVMSGHDPVLALDQRQLVPGRREYGIFVEQRVFLFSSENTLQRFQADPARYAWDAIQMVR